jgi:hypothetical protein
VISTTSLHCSTAPRARCSSTITSPEIRRRLIWAREPALAPPVGHTKPKRAPTADLMAEGSKGRVIVLGVIGREPLRDTAAVATALRFGLAFLVIGELGTGR